MRLAKVPLPSILMLITLITMLLPRESFANGNPADSGETIRFPVWYTPSPINRIYGLAIMPFGSGFFYDTPQAVTGLALHGVGIGLVLPFAPQQFLDKYKDIGDSRDVSGDLGATAGKVVDIVLDRDRERIVDSAAASELGPDPAMVSIHGGLVSLTGTVSDRMNGLSVSFFSTAHGILNGVSICPVYNRTFQVNGLSIGAINDSFQVRGIQIGIFNSTYHLNGIQLGIINRNKTRTTPLFNWSTDK